MDTQGNAATYVGLEPTGSIFYVLASGTNIARELAPWNNRGHLNVSRRDQSTADAKTLLTIKVCKITGAIDEVNRILAKDVSPTANRVAPYTDEF
jgi:hypothetical protein